MPGSSGKGSRPQKYDHVVLLALVDDAIAAILLAIILIGLVMGGVITPPLALVVGIAGSAVIAIVAYKSTMALLMKPKIGSGMVGRRGVAVTEVTTEGTVLIDGEYWKAWSQAPIPRGEVVVVVAGDGLKLSVVAEGKA